MDMAIKKDNSTFSTLTAILVTMAILFLCRATINDNEPIPTAQHRITESEYVQQWVSDTTWKGGWDE